MDMRKYYDITHSAHRICNPTSSEKINALIELLKLPSGAEVIDIACGKGEFLIRLVERYGVSGVGYDISSYYIGEAKKALVDRVTDAKIRFEVKGGEEVEPYTPVDVTSCIGASWIYGGHLNTLNTLSSMVKFGGWIIVGEPYWLQEPASVFLAASGLQQGLFGMHESNQKAGEKVGLELIQSFESTTEDWDHYQELQWSATKEYTRRHPEDSDLKYVLEQVQKEKENYQRWGRGTIGWALYLFRKAE